MNGKPLIFHNAWNLDKRKLALFSNRAMIKKTRQSIRGAINATHYVRVFGSSLHRGNGRDRQRYILRRRAGRYRQFRKLDRGASADLDEIWVSRIVDSKQVRKPKNLHDALANLCQLFAATVGEDDVKLFKYHIRSEEPKSRSEQAQVIEIHVPAHINFKWNHSNLENGRELGKAAAEASNRGLSTKHAELKRSMRGPHFINENPEVDDKAGLARAA